MLQVYRNKGVLSKLGSGERIHQAPVMKFQRFSLLRIFGEESELNSKPWPLEALKIHRR